jgi:TRAP-type C4-dicarboxylate transport system substrate-binding protein
MRYRPSRRVLITGLVTLVAAALNRPAELLAQEELRLHSFIPPAHVIARQVIVPWSQAVAQASNSRLSVRFFPSQQLGGRPDDLYDQAAQGIVDIVFTLPGYTSSAFPRTTLVELPGMASSAVDGTERIWRVFEQHLAAEYAPVRVLALWTNDNAVLMSKSRPIRRLEDMRGIKIRAPSAVQAAQLEALGATPIDLPANQIYNALDRGVIDAALIPISVVIDFRLGEVVRHYTLGAPLGRSPFVIAMNRRRYERLPAELRAAIDQTSGRALSVSAARAYEERGAEAMARIRAEGRAEVIELGEDERRRWRAALTPLTDRLIAEQERPNLPARALVDAYRAGAGS